MFLVCSIVIYYSTFSLLILMKKIIQPFCLASKRRIYIESEKDYNQLTLFFEKRKQSQNQKGNVIFTGGNRGGLLPALKIRFFFVCARFVKSYLLWLHIINEILFPVLISYILFMFATFLCSLLSKHDCVYASKNWAFTGSIFFLTCFVNDIILLI